MFSLWWRQEGPGHVHRTATFCGDRVHQTSKRLLICEFALAARSPLQRFCALDVQNLWLHAILSWPRAAFISLLRRSCVSGIPTCGANVALPWPRATFFCVQTCGDANLPCAASCSAPCGTAPLANFATTLSEQRPGEHAGKPHAQHLAPHLSHISRSAAKICNVLRRVLRMSAVVEFGKGTVQDAA